MGPDGYVLCLAGLRKRTQNFCWKSEVKSPLVRPSRKEEDNIKNDVKILKPKTDFMYCQC
jgi:hypothetical protein